MLYLLIFLKKHIFSITLYAYKCKLISGDLTLSEHTDSKWVTVEEMKNMNFAEADKPLIELLKKVIFNEIYKSCKL